MKRIGDQLRRISDANSSVFSTLHRVTSELVKNDDRTRIVANELGTLFFLTSMCGSVLEMMDSQWSTKAATQTALSLSRRVSAGADEDFREVDESLTLMGIKPTSNTRCALFFSNLLTPKYELFPLAMAIWLDLPKEQPAGEQA